MILFSALAFGQSAELVSANVSNGSAATAIAAADLPSDPVPTASSDSATAAQPGETTQPDAATQAADSGAATADSVSPNASNSAPEASATSDATPPEEDPSLAEIKSLSAQLEEANVTIDKLRSESADLSAKADEAEKKAQAAIAISEASDAQRQVAEKVAAQAAELSSELADKEAKIAELEAARDKLSGKLASFGSLTIDTAKFPELLRSGFGGAQTRLGSWKITGGVLSQVDKNQYFSRMTFPLVQSSSRLLYSFETKTSAKGWTGTGIHLFADKVKKPRGYGEGKSLLVWLTRDAKVRGNEGSYLQVYRSDSDVSMERVLDAKIQEKLDRWNRVDVLYEPDTEFIVIAVNGTVRAAYRSYFGIGAGATVSLRTLGSDVQFRNFEVRK
jgi:Chromosome segregation ATPases